MMTDSSHAPKSQISALAEAARRLGCPPEFLAAVHHEESGNAPPREEAPPCLSPA